MRGKEAMEQTETKYIYVYIKNKNLFEELFTKQSNLRYMGLFFLFLLKHIMFNRRSRKHFDLTQDFGREGLFGAWEKNVTLPCSHSIWLESWNTNPKYVQQFGEADLPYPLISFFMQQLWHLWNSRLNKANQNPYTQVDSATGSRRNLAVFSSSPNLKTKGHERMKSNTNPTLWDSQLLDCPGCDSSGTEQCYRQMQAGLWLLPS